MRLVGIATFSAFVETSFKRITCNFSGACCFLCPAPTHTGVLCLSRSHRAPWVRLGDIVGVFYLAMKPTAPLLALPYSGMKLPSPLRAMKGHFWAISTLQRCCRFQWGAQRGLQRCCRFQSCPVIACYARKSSPSVLKMAQNRRFMACWAKLFADEPLKAPCRAKFFVEEPLKALMGNVSMCVRSPCGRLSPAGEKFRMQFPSAYFK